MRIPLKPSELTQDEMKHLQASIVANRCNRSSESKEMRESSLSVYVVLGIDAHEHDQVLAVCRNYTEAKRFCTKCTCTTQFFDLWIEKHALM